MEVPVENPLPALPLVGGTALVGVRLNELVPVGSRDDIVVDVDNCAVMKNVDGNASISRLLKSDSLTMI